MGFGGALWKTMHVIISPPLSVYLQRIWSGLWYPTLQPPLTQNINIHRVDSLFAVCCCPIDAARRISHVVGSFLLQHLFVYFLFPVKCQILMVAVTCEKKQHAHIALQQCEFSGWQLDLAACFGQSHDGVSQTETPLCLVLNIKGTQR